MSGGGGSSGGQMQINRNTDVPVNLASQNLPKGTLPAPEAVTFSPAIPSYLSAVADQLSAGYGNDPEEILAQLENLYRPMTIQSMPYPISSYAQQGGGGQQDTGRPSRRRVTDTGMNGTVVATPEGNVPLEFAGGGYYSGGSYGGANPFMWTGMPSTTVGYNTGNPVLDQLLNGAGDPNKLVPEKKRRGMRR